MKYFYLIANPGREGTSQAVREIQAYLKKRGAVCTGCKSRAPEKGETSDLCFTEASEIPAETECVITLGGDGPLIQAARDLVELQGPMLGVNRGDLGGRARVARGATARAGLEALMEDRFTLEKRMMLEARLVGDERQRRGIALNDIVLTRKDMLQALHFRVYLNGVLFNEYMADGMIVATPTGSTAYNLSAGGPIVAPGAELILVTPVCAHSLFSRSIVLPPEDIVSIRLAGDQCEKQTVVLDGKQRFLIGEGDTLEIRRAKKATKLIQLSDVSFLENIRRKMNQIGVQEGRK